MTKRSPLGCGDRITSDKVSHDAVDWSATVSVAEYASETLALQSRFVFVSVVSWIAPGFKELIQ
jgi:hypothetical protein